MVRYFDPSSALARSRIHLDRDDQMTRRTQISPEKHASLHFTLGLSATRKLSCNRVREVIEANRRGTWRVNALIGKSAATEKTGLKIRRSGTHHKTNAAARSFNDSSRRRAYGSRTILPAAPGSRISLWARAASASGNSLPTTGRSVPFSRPAIIPA